MLDRALKLIVSLVFLLLLLRTAVSIVAWSIAGIMRGLLGLLVHGLGVLGFAIVSVLIAVFSVGLAVRASKHFALSDPASARDRVARQRALRTRVRRPAEGLAEDPTPEQPDESDPAIGEE